MGALVGAVRPILLSALKSCHTKRLVCELIDRYVDMTDNDIDNVLAETVKKALLRDCK